jgi:hypothetical protein
MIARLGAAFLPLLVSMGCVLIDASPEGTGSIDPPGGSASPGGTEAARVQGMTAAHNAVRRRTSASAALPDLEWSEELAGIAQAYAEELARNGCDLIHSKGGSFGENLASFGGERATPTRVVELWAAEEECYTFGTFARGDSCTCDACGHYTQIVWRNTDLVGCGVADCGGNEEVWVCNYDPPGNYVGQRPY